jgi:hypothetical protein
MSGEHNEKEQASLPSRLAALSGSESSNDPSTKLPATVNAKLTTLPQTQQPLSALTQRVVSQPSLRLYLIEKHKWWLTNTATSKNVSSNSVLTAAVDS